MTDHIDTAQGRAKLSGLTGFTPGPWFAGRDYEDGPFVAGGGYCLINTVGPELDREPNARLIAAAPDLLTHIHRLLDAIDAMQHRIAGYQDEIANLLDDRDEALVRAEKAEAERGQAIKALSKAAEARGRAEGKLAASELPGIIDGWKARSERAEAERDQALARAAAAAMEMREQAARVASMFGQGSQGIKTSRAIETRIRSIPIDPDAEAALQRVVDAARLEGWRAGRDAATEPLTSLAAVLRKSENSYHQSQASAMLERADAIRALPEPKEASHE